MRHVDDAPGGVARSADFGRLQDSMTKVRQFTLFYTIGLYYWSVMMILC